MGRAEIRLTDQQSRQRLDRAKASTICASSIQSRGNSPPKSKSVLETYISEKTEPDEVSEYRNANTSGQVKRLSKYALSTI